MGRLSEAAKKIGVAMGILTAGGGVGAKLGYDRGVIVGKRSMERSDKDVVKTIAADDKKYTVDEADGGVVADAGESENLAQKTADLKQADEAAITAIRADMGLPATQSAPVGENAGFAADDPGFSPIPDAGLPGAEKLANRKVKDGVYTGSLTEEESKIVTNYLSQHDTNGVALALEKTNSPRLRFVDKNGVKQSVIIHAQEDGNFKLVANTDSGVASTAVDLASDELDMKLLNDLFYPETEDNQ